MENETTVKLVIEPGQEYRFSDTEDANNTWTGTCMMIDTGMLIDSNSPYYEARLMVTTDESSDDMAAFSFSRVEEVKVSKKTGQLMTGWDIEEV